MICSDLLRFFHKENEILWLCGMRLITTDMDVLPWCKGSEFSYNIIDKFISNVFIDTQGAKSNFDPRSEEHTSELQSRENLVCRLLLEKKKKNKKQKNYSNHTQYVCKHNF